MLDYHFNDLTLRPNLGFADVIVRVLIKVRTVVSSFPCRPKCNMTSTRSSLCTNSSHRAMAVWGNLKVLSGVWSNSKEEHIGLEFVDSSRVTCCQSDLHLCEIMINYTARLIVVIDHKVHFTSTFRPGL